jgi:hypothetical protein
VQVNQNAAEEQAAKEKEEREAKKKKEETAEEESRRAQEELKQAKERAAEKKRQKKEARRTRFLEENKQQMEDREKFWRGKIEHEKEAVEAMIALMAGEFCRKRSDVMRVQLMADKAVQENLRAAAQETFRELYDDDSRVTVKSMEKGDWNDRTGTIQQWDEQKQKYYVGLDTKKGKNMEYMYFSPANLEPTTKSVKSKSKKGKRGRDYLAVVPKLWGHSGLTMVVEKKIVEEALKADNLSVYVDSLMMRLNQEDLERAEEERRREEEERRRRAEKKRREEEEWERKQAEYREYRERAHERREWARRERRSGSHGPRCGCMECEIEREFMFHLFERMFGARFRGGRGGRSFRGGSIPFEFFFSTGGYDSDEDSYYDDEFNRMHEEELEQKRKEAAELLNVEEDAGQDEIKRSYRALARMYHPDKYRGEDNHVDGMTKKESEDHFKKVSDAYDTLMATLDD